MDPWMDEPADGGAGALFSRFVCRVSGAPADTVDELRAERTLALLGDLQATQARVDAAREQVSALLFTAIGAAQEKPARNKLITLKRDLYNGKVPSAQKLDDALAGVDAEPGAAVRAYAADLERTAELRARVAASHDAEQAELRKRFAALVGDPDFQKGVLVSSRSLHGNLGRYAQAAAKGELSGRDEKTERGLLRYFTRMAMKSTPFGTFCAIIPGTFTEDGPGHLTFEGDPRQKRSFVRINKLMYGLLVDHLKLRPAVRHALAVERNPTMRVENNRLVFLTAIDGREVFQRVPDNEVLQLIASRFQEGTEPTLGDLIDALSADPEIDATPDEAEAYLDKLLEIGFLRFHMGIREQDADWDLPLAALLERIDDPQAQRAAVLLRTVRQQTEVYATADVQARPEVIAGMLKLIEDEFEEMGIGQRLRKDMPFYEDATSEASARIGLTPGVRRAFGSFEEWCRMTASLAWPRSEQATMRHFFNDFYGEGASVPLLKFYEDFYREHFKAHVEKENRARGGMGAGDGYDVNNPFGLQFITDLNSARGRLAEIVRKRWEAEPDTAAIDIAPEDVEKSFEGVETHSSVARSMGAFALLAPGDGDDNPSMILNNTAYTSGYGKYFSRFLYMLPDDVQEDVRRENAALSDDLLAEICGDAQFNANLHPPLLRWEISYPTGESGATEDQVRSSDLLVEEDPEEAHSLSVRHGPTGKRVIPLDLGFLNPRMRPPLYQLLSRFTPPVMYAPPIPETADPPKPAPEKPAVDVEGVTVQPAPD
ncbi:MAG TPA: lantibiotic dehydratase, partial [Longimicrobium sp.]|nr:lantibiotic dehydratase [Longimicrobium sp.]